MALWIRFEYDGRLKVGTVERDTITVHSGDLFGGATPTGQQVALKAARILTPCDPTKMICLWNNFPALAAKLGVQAPEEPLYFLKAPSAFVAHGGVIQRPKSYAGKVAYEGELGIVIGKQCSNVSEAEVPDHIFGYTCVNDVTAVEIINKDPTFPQWTRAKSFDTFGAFGPAIATALDPMKLTVKTILNGEKRQNYSVRDMFFSPFKLVSLLSRDMTLVPGDIIACGTSLGVGAMKEQRNTIEVSIDGVGALTNLFVQ